MKNIRIFSEIHFSEWSIERVNGILSKVKSLNKESVLGSSKDEHLLQLMNAHSLKPLVLDFDNIILGEETIETVTIDEQRYGGRRFNAKKYLIPCYINYSGDSILFSIRPKRFKQTTTLISVDSRLSRICFQVEIIGEDKDKFNSIKSDAIRKISANLKNINDWAEQWNVELFSVLKKQYELIIDDYTKEKGFLSSIGIEKSAKAFRTFEYPIRKKKNLSVQIKSDRLEEPKISIPDYSFILDSIRQCGTEIECKPSIYINKHEEDLRDIFILSLSQVCNNVTITGESKNNKGRTDILIKYPRDNSNLFIAECKIWSSQNDILDALTQLFGRYLTWRDTKTALLIFVKRNDMTKVIQKVKEIIPSHPNYIRHISDYNESSFSYKFKLSTDQDKEAFLEVMLFHFPN